MVNPIDAETKPNWDDAAASLTEGCRERFQAAGSGYNVARLGTSIALRLHEARLIALFSLNKLGKKNRIQTSAMPTPLDRAVNSRNAFLGFAGAVAAAAAWSIWNGELFPAEKDPTGDPTTWEYDELQRWLRNRGLMPDGKATREELIQRVQANLRPKRT